MAEGSYLERLKKLKESEESTRKNTDIDNEIDAAEKVIEETPSESARRGRPKSNDTAGKRMRNFNLAMQTSAMLDYIKYRTKMSMSEIIDEAIAEYAQNHGFNE